jgi:hypothetical protein
MHAGTLAHYAGREPGVLNIFFEYSLKMPRIYSNMLEYTRIYSNILEYFLVGRARRSTGRAGRAGSLRGQAGTQTTLPRSSQKPNFMPHIWISLFLNEGMTKKLYYVHRSMRLKHFR